MGVFATECWNCRSKRFRETAAMEECPDCGIRCDYHGDGANAAYDAAMARVQIEEARRREADETAARRDWDWQEGDE